MCKTGTRLSFGVQGALYTSGTYQENSIPGGGRGNYNASPTAGDAGLSVTYPVVIAQAGAAASSLSIRGWNCR